MSSTQTRLSSALPALLGVSLLLGAGVSLGSETPESRPLAGEKVRPNEAGLIPILMYHRIGHPEGVWTRTPQNFRRDLTELYERGYRPVSLTDLVRGHIDLPAGLSPVVLTFDDGHEGQLRFLEENGKTSVDPDCAVGMLLVFHHEHPDFPIEATFFLNGETPFGQPEYVREKLDFIVSHGMDIGNHTTVHADLHHERFHNPRAIQRVIGEQAAYLQDALKDFVYEVNTFALCHGHRPPGKSLRSLLASGSFENRGYNNIAILNVGSGPSSSPIDKDFTPLSLPRIRASRTNVKGFGMYDWLERLDKAPPGRFVSDGDPEVFTVVEALRGRVDPRKIRPRRLVVRRNEAAEP